jgi:MinD superfamily P-loop ATPase
LLAVDFEVVGFVVDLVVDLVLGAEERSLAVELATREALVDRGAGLLTGLAVVVLTEVGLADEVVLVVEATGLACADLDRCP